MSGRGRSFWKWLVLTSRAIVIADIHHKRLMRENLEMWNEANREEIEKFNREDWTRISKPSSDESSTCGHFGGDCGDGSF